MFTHFKALFFDKSLEPNVMIFASLCNLDNLVDLKLKHCAARIFLCSISGYIHPHTRSTNLIYQHGSYVRFNFFCNFMGIIRVIDPTVMLLGPKSL